MRGGIRVLSCNLFSGRADAAALKAVIERHGVDIVCVQELSPVLAQELSRPMRLRIDHCFVHRLGARSAKVIEIPGSDHLGLCVDLAVPDTAGESARVPGDGSGRGARTTTPASAVE